MDDGKRRRQTLKGLLARYALAVCLVVGVLLLFWLTGLYLALKLHFVQPAYTAQRQAEAAAAAMEKSGQFDQEMVPALCGYVLFDKKGAVLESSLSGGALRDAQNYRQTGQNGAWRYHILVRLEAEDCVLQYKFETPYTSPLLRGKLPDFQILYLVLLLLLAVLTFWGVTVRFSRILRRRLQLLTGAAQQLEAGELDSPFAETGVKEFDQVLGSMDKLRHALQKSLQEQWRMEQERSAQTAALAHDLKTPLTVISGNAELLMEEELSQEDQACVDAILRNADTAKKYLETLKTLGEAAALREEDGKAILHELQLTAQELCRTGGAVLLLSGETPERIYADRVALVRAVTNLLDNAARYAGKGGEVCFSVQMQEGKLAFQVEESGPGFTEEALRHGADWFYTEGKARQQDGHRGLGLSFAAAVAVRHGGSLLLQNREEGGGRAVLTIGVAPPT